MFTKFAIFASVLATVTVSSVPAADRGLCVSAGVTQAARREIGRVSGLDLSDTRYKIIAGVRPLDVFAVEATYVDLGSATTPAGQLDAAPAHPHAVAAYGGVFLPMPLVDRYAKGDVARWKVSGQSTPVAPLRRDDADTQLADGAGGPLSADGVAARPEYAQFDVSYVSNVSRYSPAATYAF
ncbi:MAG TPA: hypothetical protein VF315_04945 [Steroidobacteraceae bacterium]